MSVLLNDVQQKLFQSMKFLIANSEKDGNIKNFHLLLVANYSTKFRETSYFISMYLLLNNHFYTHTKVDFP